MKNFSTWMIVLFALMFWAFRAVVAVTAEMNMDFGGITPLNIQMEIILLFVVLVCILLIIKRKVIGGLIYLLSYGMYFGIFLLNNISQLTNAVEGNISMSLYINILISIIAMVLPIAALMDLIMDKSRKIHYKDGKTDWFYDNEQFDRKLDERADKNNYRTM